MWPYPVTQTVSVLTLTIKNYLKKRAETVANYLVSKGVAQDTISATGYGKANPVTGNQCDAVKGRKALIACLADDRRVEIAVNGNQ